jgi:transposase
MAEPCPQCAILQQQIAELQAQIEHLRRALEHALRAGKRQAAPFGKEPPVAQPKTPGRKRGRHHGRHGHRPPPDGPVHECVQAPLPATCPHCFGDVAHTHTDTQYQLDLPREPLRRRIDIHCGHCSRCQRPLRGRHPCQTSDATGAAASQLGPDAQAAVVVLNKQLGLSHAKVARLLTDVLGIPLTRGASAQIVLRAAERLQPAYEQILSQLPQQPWLSVDETGWRIGGQPAWLHVWVGAAVTAYAIDPQRSADRLEAVLGRQWSGVLVHDGWASYDRFEEAVHQQCVAHVIVRARELEAQAVGRAKVFPRQVIKLFQGALAVRDAAVAGALNAAVLAAAHERYVNALLDLTERPRVNAANEALARHLYAHGEQWLMFLIDPSLPATNWPAEQATRPAVVNRKVWGGNRTVRGAEAQGALMSVLATCRQQACSAWAYVSQSLCGIIGNLFPHVMPALER